MRKRFAIVMVLLLTLVLVGTVTAEELDKKTASDVYFDEIGEYGGSYTLSLTSAPQTFNYYGGIDASTFNIMTNVLDSLTEENPVTQEIEPGLASDWDIEDDGETVILHLREGVKWSDGEPFNADDVIFTMENLTLNSNAEANEVARYTIEGEIVEFSKVDDMTIKVELPAPFGPFMRMLSQAPIMPEHKLSEHVSEDDPGAINEAWATDVDPEDVVGTGPFTLKDYVVDQRVVLERNPHSWRYDPEGNRLPYVDELDYLIVRNSEVQVAQFQAGEIDSVSISGQDYTPLKQAEIDGEDFSVYAGSPVGPTPSPTHLSFNFDVEDEALQSAFREDKFRVAMEHLIDRERIIEEVYNTLAIKSGTPVVPTNEAFYNPEIEDIRREYNPDRAAELLDELGYVDENGDGYRQLEDGSQLEFDLTANVGADDHSDIAGLIKNSLEDVGIKVHLDLVEGGLVFELGQSGDFQAMLQAFGNQPDPQFRKAIWQPTGDLYYWHQSIEDDDGNPIFENMYDWEEDVYDAFEAGQVTLDPEERKTHYDEWQKIYAEKLPVIFITKGMDVMAVQNNVGNHYMNEDDVIVNINYTVFKK
ncbi:MAG: ABC transporter substrate-binding protein [Bacillota bacterium]